MEKHEKSRNTRNIYFGLLLVSVFLALAISLYFMHTGSSQEASGAKGVDITADSGTVPSHTDPNRIENGIHVRTGLVEGNGMIEVVNNCTPCHSAKLVTQNRMSREGWLATIHWMQKTQNLWDLGDKEPVILDYLAEHYAPKNKGRREALSHIEWYKLKE